MACTYTTEMYLNIGTDICATISAWRNSGSTAVHFDVSFSEDQKRGQTYYSWNTNAIKAAVDGYTDWITVKAAGNATSGSATTSFRMETNSYGGGSRTFDIIFAVFNNAESATVGGIPRFQVSVGWGSSATQPASPSVSIAERYADGAKFNVSVSNYGTPGGADGRYIEGAILNQNSYGATYKYAIARNTDSSSITVNNSSSGGTLNIKSNTRYWYGGYVTNTIMSKSSVSGQFITLPSAPVASTFYQTGTSATFDITESSNGTAQTVQLQYRYKKHSDPESSYSSWTNAGNAGNHQTESVSLTDLSTATVYDVQTRSKGADSSYSSINTYDSAFTTDDIVVSIINLTNSYIQTGSNNKCRTTIEYVITAAGLSEGTTFDIVSKGTFDGQTYDKNQEFGVATSGTFVVGDFPLDTEVTITVKTKINGTARYGSPTSVTFTTPTFTPNAPTVSNVKWRSEATLGFRWGATFDLTAATPGEGETFTKMYWKVEIFDNTTNQWVQVYNPQAITTTTYSGSIQTVWDAMRYPKIALSAWQENNLGIISPVTKVVYTNRPLATGVIVPEIAWNKKYIVGIKTKATDGTLNPGNHAYHYVIK